MENSANRLILQEVSKTFPQREGKGLVHAVDKVSLEIPQGEFLTLLGPSGCGKTTTLRLIAGFEVATSGKIFLAGKDITNNAPNKRNMAMVFQSYALFPHMTVFDNIAYGLQIRGLPRKVIEQNVNHTLELIGLTDLGKRRPNELSGGQQQRVALARSLVMEPEVLLFDEPLSNLDAKLRVQMRSEIHSLQRRLNVTSVYVTHDQVEAMALSDRIVVMNQGQIEQIGSPKEIYRRPISRFVADFIGRANFLPVQVTSASNGQVTVNLLNQNVDVPLDNLPAVDTSMTALLRPEGLTLRDDASLKQGLVLQAMYLGAEVEYIVEVDQQQLVVVDNDPRASHIFAEGQTVGVDFVHETVHLLKDNA